MADWSRIMTEFSCCSDKGIVYLLCMLQYHNLFVSEIAEACFIKKETGHTLYPGNLNKDKKKTSSQYMHINTAMTLSLFSLFEKKTLNNQEHEHLT